MKRFFQLATVLALMVSVFAASCSKEEDYAQKEVDAIAKAISQYPDSSFKAAYDVYGNAVLRYIKEAGDSTAIDSNKDTVELIYSGKTLQKNFVFAKDEKYTVPVRYLIPGFRIGLHGVKRKSKLTLIIPYSLAYGSSGNGNVEPYSTLLFDITVK